ncbi:MAG: hypothetical protein JWP14_2422 [Frankiales bacterium]|nr:hypothetical protein [Frankiales bacterium]
MSQQRQRDGQNGKPHERKQSAEKQALDKDHRESASAAYGYVHQHGHESAQRLMFR